MPLVPPPNPRPRPQDFAPRKRRRQCARPGPAGHTLIELLVSMAVLTLLMAAMGSTVLLAGHAIPSANDPLGTTIGTATVTDRITAELGEAIYLADRSATGVTIVVHDRDGDGTPERIRYAWSRSDGDAVTRQYNNGAAVALGPALSRFNLIYDTTTQRITVPGPATEDLLESELLMVDGAHDGDFKVDTNDWCGQYLNPDLPAEATGYRISRVVFSAKQEDTIYKDLFVVLRKAGPNRTPASGHDAYATINESDLSLDYGWETVAFTGNPVVPAGQGRCITFECYNGEPGYIEQTQDTRAVTTSAHPDWDYNADTGLRMYVYGYITRHTADLSIDEQRINTVQLTLRGATTGSQTQHTRVQLPNQPPVAAAYWAADFDTPATAADSNGDGQADWAPRSGAATAVASGTWRPNTTLDTQPVNTFTAPSIIDLRMRADQTGGLGPVFWINTNLTSGRVSPIGVSLTLESDHTQTLVLHTQDSSGSATELTRATGLGTGFHDLRLIVLPDTHAVFLALDGAPVGTYAITPRINATADGVASLLSGGHGGQIDDVRILVIED